ncbi:hypothetical protein L914_14763 [Phytophthora nicotianae]|uniref:Uncharacterized protein n=2 Tax=Phytophthora nicotianae TaxID=4792 RepID=V9EKJ4_PHYNI|nr:hypothetical protein F443_15346 [Phytophthora nicotianae P1569]ETM39044.1 hypothetical protein L914_14763 [Phytophthora nicotianae]
MTGTIEGSATHERGVGTRGGALWSCGDRHHDCRSESESGAYRDYDRDYGLSGLERWVRWLRARVLAHSGTQDYAALSGDRTRSCSWACAATGRAKYWLVYLDRSFELLLYPFWGRMYKPVS